MPKPKEERTEKVSRAITAYLAMRRAEVNLDKAQKRVELAVTGFTPEEVTQYAKATAVYHQDPKL